MVFQIDPKKSMPLYEQVVQQVKEMCIKGILTPHEKLPSVRELSSQMVINPNTVSKAYQELERQGIIVTVRGRGTFISENVAKPANPEQTKKIKEQLKQVVIDSHHSGFSKKELLRWLNEIHDDMEGQRNGD